jgi:hypothetical protein
MKTSTVLKRAKTCLATSADDYMFTNRQAFICYAINNAMGIRNYKEGKRVQAMIQARLRPYTALESWLQGNHNIERISYDPNSEKFNEYRTQVQRTRHAWVDSMIAEFEAKGD